MISFVVSALFAVYRFFCVSWLLLHAGSSIGWTWHFYVCCCEGFLLVRKRVSFGRGGGVERDQTELSIMSSAVWCLQRLQSLNWPRFQSLIALLALVKWPTLIQSTVHYISSSRGCLEWPWQFDQWFYKFKPEFFRICRRNLLVDVGQRPNLANVDTIQGSWSEIESSANRNRFQMICGAFCWNRLIWRANVCE